MGSLAIIVDKALNWIYNGTLIDPELLEEENVATVLEDGSKEEVVDKDKALSSVEQR
jgi:hypothetical protein